MRVNGQVAGTTWFAPYRIDIGKLAKRGDDKIAVKVANIWVNRLIGDQQPGAQKETLTAAPTYMPNAPLRPSGLIGPVTRRGQRRRAIAPAAHPMPTAIAMATRP